MNRRTFLGAAVAATILPAGEALADPAPSGRTIEAHETPEGVLYTVRDGERETRVIQRPGTYAYDLDHDAIDRARAEDLSLRGKLVIRNLPPPLFEYTIESESGSDRRVIPCKGVLGPVCGFRSPPTLEDVVAFHDACGVPGRHVDALVTPAGNFWRVTDVGTRSTNLHGGSVDSCSDLRTADYPRKSVPSGMCSLAAVLAFHEQCIAEDDACAFG